MSRSDSGLVEVELDEDEGDGEVLPTGPARTWRSRVAGVPRRVWMSAGALVAVGAVTLGTVGVVERVAVGARLARTDGLSASLAQPLVRAWATGSAQPIAAADGAVLVQGLSRVGGQAVSALDAATGRVRWTQPGRCEPVLVGRAGAGALLAASRLAAMDADDLLMCVHDDDGGDGRAATVTTHDPATGAVLHSIALDPVSTRTTSTLGGDLVGVGIESDGRVRAGRWSLRTGERLWDYRSPDVPGVDLEASAGVGFSVGADEVLVQVGPWEVRLDPGTGEPMPAGAVVADVEHPWGPVALPDGATATAGVEPGGSPVVTVQDAGGRTRFTATGYLLPSPVVDDGTGPPTVLTMDLESAEVVALDAATGRERWRSTTAFGDRAVLSGLVVVTDGSRTTALDARTGEPRWDSGAADTTSWGLVTDGRRLLTVEQADTGAVLVARDVLTGESVWTVDSPVGPGELRQLPDGSVLAVGATGVASLRRPADRRSPAD